MSDPLSDTFRANVRAAMRLQRLTYTTLGKRMKVSCDSVSKTINNPRGIGVTLDTVARFAQALDIEPSVLLIPGGVAKSRNVRHEQAA